MRVGAIVLRVRNRPRVLAKRAYCTRREPDASDAEAPAAYSLGRVELLQTASLVAVDITLGIVIKPNCVEHAPKSEAYNRQMIMEAKGKKSNFFWNMTRNWNAD